MGCSPQEQLGFLHGGKEMKLEGAIAGAGAGTIPSLGQMCSLTPRKQRRICALISVALAPRHWLSLGHGGAVTQLRDLTHPSACPVQGLMDQLDPVQGSKDCWEPWTAFYLRIRCI